jgi:hypothetical protein
MKFPISKQNLLTLAAGYFLLIPWNAMAITSLVQFAKNDSQIPLESELDPFYNDGNSTVFKGQVKEGDLSATLSARYYDSDPLRPGTNGLINSDLPWNRADPNTPDPGWLIRFGLNPDKIGVFTHTYTEDGISKTVDASYISFKMSSPETVIYEGASLTIDKMENVTPSEVWAVVSDENFKNTRVAKVTPGTNGLSKLIWEWDKLEISSKGLEIRVYGLQGADEGFFSVGDITTSYRPPAVPEPSISCLLGLAALGLVNSRRRRS